MKTILTAAASAAVFLAAAGVSYAQQGTTLAGPAQGSKADGSNSTIPSGQSGANGLANGQMRSQGGGPATGEMSGGSTATGGNAGGAVGRN